jgi:diphosphomevalonate decarboxylase
MRSQARARANIALIKYWGKSDTALNTPAVGSISITLDALWSDTEIEFAADFPRDTLLLDGNEDAGQLARVSRCLDLLRRQARIDLRAHVSSRNNFPTGAGLASSASGFAALVAAAARALGLALSPTALSTLARQGSGSAARSIFGGYVEMRAGGAADGSDSFAVPLLSATVWPITVVIAVTQKPPKTTGSGEGMRATAESSPYYAAWIETNQADLTVARTAILNQDFSALAEVAEHNCLKMHALALAGRPPLLYWNAATVACIDAIRALQATSVPVFFTIDAGPQVKAVCLPEVAEQVANRLRAVPGVLDIIVSELGPGIETD